MDVNEADAVLGLSIIQPSLRSRAGSESCRTTTMNMTRSSQKHPLAGFNNDGCGSVEKSNSASGFGSMPMTTSESHTTGRRIGMTFVSRHTSPRPITVLKNHGRRSGTDSGAWAFLHSSRSNPPALSTACSTASLFSTGRWDASFSIVALRASFACST